MVRRLVTQSLLALGDKVEILISEALENEQVLGVDLENIYWAVMPNGVETLCFRGKPLLELHPLEVEQKTDGSNVVFNVSRKYRTYR